MTERLTDSVSDVLSGYSSHNIDSLKQAALMKRVDTKFLFPVRRLPEILGELSAHFSALEIDGKRQFSYANDYFDSRDLRFYRMHHNKYLNRYKVRIRSYCDTGQSYLEVKFKNNKKHTTKTRMPLYGPGAQVDYLSDEIEFLQSSGIAQASQLVPTLKNSYQRIALASEVRAERLTIDIGLQSQGLHDRSDSFELKNLAIVELKQKRIDRSSPFFSLIRGMGIRSSRFSKYCMGLALSTPGNAGLKVNRFRRLMRQVEKIESNPCLSFVG